MDPNAKLEHIIEGLNSALDFHVDKKHFPNTHQAYRDEAFNDAIHAIYDLWNWMVREGYGPNNRIKMVGNGDDDNV